jgi:hypothetical protein
MIDPVSAIGLTASAAQLAGLAKDVVGNMWTYFDAVKNAPKLSEQLRQEMAHISTLLDSMDETFIGSVFTDKAPLDEFLAILEELNSRVAARKTKGLGRWKWPFTQEENKQLISRIDRYKTTFLLALNIKSA